MDFNNQYLCLLFEIGGVKVYLTESLLATWIIGAVLILFGLVVRIKARRFTDVPSSGFQNIMEALVELMDNLTLQFMGPKLMGFSGFFFGIFAFILLSNYSGMFGLRPPTSDLACTMALALAIFVLIHVTGARREKGRYWKSFVDPNPLLLPMNLIGEISKPISLGFRLFGNILAGVIIMGLVYSLFPVVLKFLLPAALHAYFDVFVGALQAFIFTVLSMSYIKQKADIED